MGNLSKPVQEEDGALREGLKEPLSPLPSVPNLDEEEARERIEHLLAQAGTPEKKGAWTAKHLQ